MIYPGSEGIIGNPITGHPDRVIAEAGTGQSHAQVETFYTGIGGGRYSTCGGREAGGWRVLPITVHLETWNIKGSCKVLI